MREGLRPSRGKMVDDGMLLTSETVDVAGPAAPIRCRIERPREPGAFPAILCFSDIFQLTDSTLRMCQRLAGYGFVVVAPEIYARIRPAGTAHDFERDRQAALDDQARMHVAWYDADRRAVLDWMRGHAFIDAKAIGAAGFCIGGHLAFRAALEPEVRATACCYPTGVDAGRLGVEPDAGTLARLAELQGELLLVWGRRDPHIPHGARAQIHRALDEAAVRFEARLYDTEHAFMRDAGPRFDPAATDQALNAMVGLFQRILRRADAGTA